MEMLIQGEWYKCTCACQRASVLKKLWRYHLCNQGKSKNDWQYNTNVAQKKKNKTNIDWQNTTQKTEGWATGTPLKYWWTQLLQKGTCMQLLIRDSVHVTLVTNSMTSHGWRMDCDYDKQHVCGHFFVVSFTITAI